MNFERAGIFLDARDQSVLNPLTWLRILKRCPRRKPKRNLLRIGVPAISRRYLSGFVILEVSGSYLHLLVQVL